MNLKTAIKISETSMGVEYVAPNCRVAHSCSSCSYLEDNSCDRLSDVRCLKHGGRFTEYLWVCDDYKEVKNNT